MEKKCLNLYKYALLILLWPLQLYALSVDFQNLPTQRALQYLSAFSHQSMIISDHISGKVTLHVENVSFAETLKIILKTQGLAQETIGPVLFIAPASIISAEEKALDSSEATLPLEDGMMTLKYANAENIAKLLKSKDSNFLSTRGVVSVDQRTNMILLRDTAPQLEKIRTLLKVLDVPVEQVQIAAKIVNMDDDYEKDLGVRFGVTSGHHLTGSLDGANTLINSPASSVAVADRLNVNLPSVAPDSARLGLALFHLTQGTMLDLELSALESEGRAEIISSPRLVTANRQEAVIESGQEIPYQEQSGNGVTSVTFKKAVLSLRVSPQIIPGKKILLHLTINQDQRSATEVLGVPEIDTRQITTQVLVNDGETIVLGGIYEQTSSTQTERVPFFSSLPVLGQLFQHHKQVKSKRELLIFITPSIVKGD